MDNMMQGYDVDAAVSQIGKAVSRAAHVSRRKRRRLSVGQSKRICAICTKPAYWTTTG